MIKIAEVQYTLWDTPQFYSVNDLNIVKGDYVVIDTYLETKEIGRVIEVKEIDKKEFENLKKENEVTQIIRKTNLKDLEKLKENEKKKSEAMEVCKKLINKNQLEMKLIDVHFSFDEKKAIFAFIAEGRIDFRLLVRDLTKYYQKNIRLQQLGIRDEAKINGDIGTCGLTQCCRAHLKVLGNVSAEQAELQQVSHRGAERLSGICNRLKCCLRYENDLYKELSEKFPAIGDQVKTPSGKGEVIEWHVLKQTVNVKLEEDTIVEVPLENLK